MTVAKIWRRIDQNYNIIGKICPECEKKIFPSREVCSSCGCYNLSDFKFKGNGEIITFTIIRTSQDSENIEIPARHIPYVLAIIKLDEGPKLTAQIVDCTLDEVKIGAKVSVVFRKILEKGKTGVIQYGYKFKIA